MPEQTPTVKIGARLRALRMATGRSLASVAHEMGISTSALSQIETGAMQPSVNRLVEFVGVLGVPVAAIFEERSVFGPTAATARADVTEPIEGVLVALGGRGQAAQLAQGVQYRRLSPVAVPGVDYFESTYPPGSSSSADGAMLVHAGHETGHVLRGTLVFEFSEGEVLLGPGQSISFEATRPHRVMNRTDDVAVAIWLTIKGPAGSSASVLPE